MAFSKDGSLIISIGVEAPLTQVNQQYQINNFRFIIISSFFPPFPTSLLANKYHSIQISNWKTDEIISFRNLGVAPVFDLVINPYNKYEFASCGYQHITIWDITGRNMNK